MTRRSFLGAAGAGLLGAQAGPRRPNLLLIVADDLGYADLGCFGNTYVQTPRLDRLASQGARFTNFVVSWPACTPSRSSILTGRYPQRNGLYDMIRNNEVNWKFQFDEATYATSPEMTLGQRAPRPPALSDSFTAPSACRRGLQPTLRGFTAGLRRAEARRGTLKRAPRPLPPKRLSTLTHPLAP